MLPKKLDYFVTAARMSLMKANNNLKQKYKTAEELTELAVEILHSEVKENRTEIVYEMADVYNMLEQIKLMYNITEREINEARTEKLDRFLNSKNPYR